MTLTIYTKPAGCFACTKTKQKFTEAAIAFREVDLTTNPAALEFVEDLGFAQAPVVLYEREGSEDCWSGLNPGKIDQVIAIETSAAA